MKNHNKYKRLEEDMQYHYKNPKLLLEALTHSSYINEHHMSKTKSNERLEFLGDAVLELITSKYLYDKYSDYTEGQLTKLRASMVCQKTLALASKKIKIANYLLLGKGEDRSGGRSKETVLSDAFEAIIGSIYLDRGLKAAEEFLTSHLFGEIEANAIDFMGDYKTALQEELHQSGDIISYHLIKEEGPDHRKYFQVEVRLDNVAIGSGSGYSKKKAEQEAAKNAIKAIKGGEDVSKIY